MALMSRWTGLAVLMLLPQCLPVALAQDYPTKPVRAIVPMATGGPTDAAMRVVGQKLTQLWSRIHRYRRIPCASSFMFIDMAVVMPHVKAGKVKLLAVVAPKRIAELPDAPTLSEGGFPGLDPGGWSAIFVPAGTPRPIIDKLNGEVRRILELPDVRKLLGSDGSDFGDNTPEYVGAFLKSEIAKWAKVIKASGARAD